LLERERDVLKVDAVDQWCLRKLLGIKCDMDNQVTTPFGCCPSTTFFPVWPHCVNARELEETTGTPLYYVDEDYPAGPEIQ